MAAPPELEKLPDEVIKDLIARSAAAKDKAYAPYSQFNVGAALLTEEGEIFTGRYRSKSNS